MANRSFYRNQNSYDRELVIMTGTIQVNASNAVTSLTLTGATAARTAAGTYQITLTDSFPSLKAAHFTIQAATAVDRVVQISSVTTSGASRIIEVRELAGATATDVGAAHAIHCTLIFSNV